MKTSLLFVCMLTFWSLSLQSQEQETCNCTEDLQFLKTTLQDTPSFKKQVKGNPDHPFYATWETLSKEELTAIPVLDCFLKLQQLATTIKDRHTEITGMGQALNSKNIKDSIWGADYQQTEVFKNHPSYDGDLSVLKQTLQKSAPTAIAGIYSYDPHLTIGVQQTGADTYEMIVLQSNLYNWAPGQYFGRLTKNPHRGYDIWYYHLVSKGLRYLSGMEVSYGNLLKVFQKEGVPNYSFPKATKNWVYERLSEDVDYLYMGSFGNADKNVAAFKTFYAQLKNTPLAPHVILDLRNNGGGNEKYSDPFLKLLRKKKVYILTNQYTGSNAEQFTLKLRKLKEVKHLGSTTRGVLAYGRNYGTTYTFPSGNFTIEPTDMNFHKYIDYEWTGIQPDQELDNTQDWILQVQQLIAKGS